MNETEARAWAGRWERMQRHYMAAREERFTMMVDYVAAQCGESGLKLLVLGARPDGITSRAASRFPDARIISVDPDPFIMEICRHSLPGRNVDWRESDLRGDEWTKDIAPGGIDAVLSATALHWITAEEVAGLYGKVARLLRKDGLFINNHHIHYAEGRLRQVGKQLHEKWQRQNLAQDPDNSWEKFWEAGRAAYPAIFAERDRLFAGRPNGTGWQTVHFHLETLRALGFQEATEVWRHVDDAMIAALR